MNIAICDDEAIDRHYILHILKKHFPYSVVYEFENGTQFLSQLDVIQPSIILLDIEMPGINGIETAKLLREHYPYTSIVFITTHSHFVLDAFGVYAFDFIPKPIDVERLVHTIHLIEKQKSESNDFIFIRTKGLTSKVNVNEILFIEKIINKCIVYTPTAVYQSISTLKYFEKQLSHKLFVRTHKSYIVNSEKISSIVSLGNQIYEILFGTYEKKAYLSRSYNEKLHWVKG